MILKLARISGFITLRSRVQIPVSLHENQPLTFTRRWFFILREVLREFLREDGLSRLGINTE